MKSIIFSVHLSTYGAVNTSRTGSSFSQNFAQQLQMEQNDFEKENDFFDLRKSTRGSTFSKISILCSYFNLVVINLLSWLIFFLSSLNFPILNLLARPLCVGLSVDYEGSITRFLPLDGTLIF